LFGDAKEKALKKLRKELRAGTYSLIILSFLKEKPMHGYAIRRAFEELSEGKLVPSEGTLYDLLKSLEKYKLVSSFWGEIGGRARKYYKITPLGEDVLNELKNELSFITKIFEKLGWENE
jgi:DNA-binding PadR family transcriptional regulator